MKPNTTIRAITSDAGVKFALARELITTDRILQRWAASSGSGLPTDKWDDSRRAKPTPLPDDVAIVVDRCILGTPERMKELIQRWYRSPQPREVIARELGISVGNIYRVRNVYLQDLRARLEAAGNAELVQLVRLIDTAD